MSQSSLTYSNIKNFIENNNFILTSLECSFKNGVEYKCYRDHVHSATLTEIMFLVSSDKLTCNSCKDKKRKADSHVDEMDILSNVVRKTRCNADSSIDDVLRRYNEKMMSTLNVEYNYNTIVDFLNEIFNDLCFDLPTNTDDITSDTHPDMGYQIIRKSCKKLIADKNTDEYMISEYERTVYIAIEEELVKFPTLFMYKDMCGQEHIFYPTFETTTKTIINVESKLIINWFSDYRKRYENALEQGYKVREYVYDNKRDSFEINDYDCIEDLKFQDSNTSEYVHKYDDDDYAHYVKCMFEKEISEIMYKSRLTLDLSKLVSEEDSSDEYVATDKHVTSEDDAMEIDSDCELESF